MLQLIIRNKHIQNKHFLINSWRILKFHNPIIPFFSPTFLTAILSAGLVIMLLLRINIDDCCQQWLNIAEKTLFMREMQPYLTVSNISYACCFDFFD